MNNVSKIQHKGQVTIPTGLCRKAGLQKGDLVEFSMQSGKIVITPKLIIDRSKFPTADDEYTPRQRKIIDARLAKSLVEAKAGKLSGPFETAEEMIKFLHNQVKLAKIKNKN